MTIKSCDVIFEEGNRHRTISSVSTTVVDIAFDDDVSATPHNTDPTPAGTVVVTPKPLAPRPRHTDPPLHPDARAPILPTATTTPLAHPQVAPAPIVSRSSARLAVLGTGASEPATTVLLTMLPDSQVPQSYWEAMT